MSTPDQPQHVPTPRTDFYESLAMEDRPNNWWDFARNLEREIEAMRVAGCNAVARAEEAHQVASRLAAEIIHAKDRELAATVADKIQLAALREDKARLDFLQENGAGCNNVETAHCWIYREGCPAHFHGLNYRAAIDAARKDAP